MIRRPNLKNLCRVSNLRRGSNMVGSSWNGIQCFEFSAGAQLELVFDGSPTRLNSLNLASDLCFLHGYKLQKFFSNPYIFATCFFISHSRKYVRSTRLGCKDIGISKSVFVAKIPSKIINLLESRAWQVSYPFLFSFSSQAFYTKYKFL